MSLNPQLTASELAEKVAALSALYPYFGGPEKKVYLFTPAEAERDLIVQSIVRIGRSFPSKREGMIAVSIPEFAAAHLRWPDDEIQ